MRPTLRSPKNSDGNSSRDLKAKPAIFLGYVEGTTHQYRVYDVAKRTVIVDRDVCVIDDVRPAKKAHPSQIVEWEADSLPKEASLEIQNRPRLEFEGEQQHNELSSKPNLTIPTEEKPQGSQEMSLDSETNPPANADPVSESRTQESQNIEGSGQTVRKSSRLQDIPQKH
jgi:hypothetical protein